VIFDDRDRLRDELLDISEPCSLFDITKRERRPTSTRSTRTTDAVDIGLRDIRDLIVDDMLELIDIDSSRGDIRRDEDACGLSLEVHERFLSR
jgi:hypothetical protein